MTGGGIRIPLFPVQPGDRQSCWVDAPRLGMAQVVVAALVVVWGGSVAVERAPLTS